jgi:uncharacterized membrane protein YfcA
MLAQDIFSAWSFRSDCDRPMLSLVLPGAIFGIALAWLLVRYLDQAAVRLAVGVIGVAFAAAHWIGLKLKPQGSASGVFWGTVAGFTGTLANAGGPPFLVCALSRALPKMTFLGTAAIFFLILNAAKLVPFFALGQFSHESLAASIALLPVAIAANLIAIQVRRIPSSAFYTVSNAMVLVVSTGLIWQGVAQYGGRP